MYDPLDIYRIRRMQALGLAEGLREELERMLAAGALEEYTLRRRTVIVTALNTVLTALLSGQPLADIWTDVVRAILDGEEALGAADVAYQHRIGQPSLGNSSSAAAGSGGP